MPASTANHGAVDVVGPVPVSELYATAPWKLYPKSLLDKMANSAMTRPVATTAPTATCVGTCTLPTDTTTYPVNIITAASPTLYNIYDTAASTGDPATDAVPASELTELDQWILLRAEDLIANCRAWYSGFEFHKVYHSVYGFATGDLSAVYFDVLKDRLYTTATRSKARRSAQTALYRLLDALVRLLAPLMSFTADEVWGHMGHKESVHIEYFPEPAELTAGMDDAARKRAANWDRLMEVRTSVLKILETARNEKLIGAPLEARVRLSANGDLFPLLEQYAGQLPGLFIVSQVDVDRAGGELGVKVERAAGVKCERCWKYTTDVGSDSKFPTVCGSCADAVTEMLNAGMLNG